jgi:hypothetical protein
LLSVGKNYYEKGVGKMDCDRAALDFIKIYKRYNDRRLRSRKFKKETEGARVMIKRKNKDPE